MKIFLKWLKTKLNIRFVVRRFFCTITYAVWLDKNNKIAGWKVKYGDINHWTSNTMNYFPYSPKEVYFKKKILFIPKINTITTRVFKNSKKWYSKWEHSELFKGFRAY